MKIYELNVGMPLKQVQEVYVGHGVENILYENKIITDGLIESKNDMSEKYDTLSKKTLRATDLYLKNYTYAIILNIGLKIYKNGKTAGFVNCIKNGSIYLRNLNDKEALKTAKEVIEQIEQANSEYKDFSMNSLLREENSEFLFDVLDENVYSAKKQINEKTIEYKVSDLYLISAKGKEKINYFLCTYNPLYNCYIEVLTNRIIEPDNDVEKYYLPLILNELNIKISSHKKINYYELIYLYNKLGKMSVINLEDKCNLVDNGNLMNFRR